MTDPWARLTAVVDTYDAHSVAVGGYERGLDIDETLIEEVGGSHGAVSWSLDTTRHDL